MSVYKYPGSKFFTNEPDKDLYTRFSKILKTNTRFFDVLVGYFRTSGFFRMYPAMEDIEKIRILVGLNVDKNTIRIIDQAGEEVANVSVSTAEAKEAFAQQIAAEYANTSATEAVEKGVLKFIEWLKSGKMEMRMYTENPIHSKVYIMRKDQEKSDTLGSVITGSSNFSEAGLLNNLEFNVELRDDDDVRFATERFEELWEKSVDIKDTIIDTTMTKTWLRDDITPYELYLRTLYEFFKEQLVEDIDPSDLVPPGYMELEYQLDAVLQARQKLKAYNGVFIADVVGLGKTFICAMLAKSFHRNTRKLIICPPVLVDYWRSVLNDYEVTHCTVESLGKLEKILADGADRYDYVFVDEAHRFRNENTSGYENLHKICTGKKVILITATPINNYTSDIANQIYLFQNKKNSTIPGVKNLEGFFQKLRHKLPDKNKSPEEYRQRMRRNSEEIREKIIRHVMIRRTRGEIKKYYSEDMEKKGLTFPEAGSPEKILYEFDETIDNAFVQTIEVLQGFKYARYTPILYLKNSDKYSSMKASQGNMGGFMKGLLIKRLESSFYAFRMSLERFIQSYEQFIAMAATGTVYISKKVDVYELLDNGDMDKMLGLIEQDQVMSFKTTDFKPAFLKDLRADLANLRFLQDMWNPVDTDPKLETFKYQLTNNPILAGKKVIVFSESKETVQYLQQNLKELFGSRVISFSGESSAALKAEIEHSFNPKYKDGNYPDKYDILITTDVLSEGINLHRSNVQINYDLPWNPTRIMQRVGRVNRVGTDFDKIFVFNFYPTAQSTKHMPLEARILEKLDFINHTLGNDFQYLTEEEDVSSAGLFEKLNQLADDEEEGPEQKYWKLIKDIRDKDKKLYHKLTEMPMNIKVARPSALVQEDSTLTMITQGALKTFFVAGDGESRQLSFLEAIEMIEATPDTPNKAIGSAFYAQLEKNSTAFDWMMTEDQIVLFDQPQLSTREKGAIKHLKALRNAPELTEQQIQKVDRVITLWENGVLTSKTTNKVIKTAALLLDPGEKLEKILESVATYLDNDEDTKIQVEGTKQVVLSCVLKPGGNA